MLIFLFFFALVNANTNLKYPGRNHKLKAIIEDEWERYYDCLENDLQSLGPSRRKKLDLRLVFPGQGIRLPCTPCFRPFEDRRGLEWRYKSFETNATEKDFTDLPSEFSLTDSQELQIRNARSEFTGIYQCFRRNSSLSEYLLEVPLLVDIVQVDHTKPNESPVELFGTSFQLAVDWGKWSECSTCGQVGKRYQYGVCMLTHSTSNQTSQQGHRQKKDIVPNINKQNQTHEKGEEKSEEKMQEDDNSKNEQDNTKQNQNQLLDESKDKQHMYPELNQLLSLFEKGIPCSSRFLPEAARSMLLNLGATHLAAVDLCKVECPTEAPAEEIDLKEKIIQAAGNIEMALKKIQDKILTVEREEIDTTIDKFVILQCPGSNNENIPVVWKAVDKDIVPEMIAEQTQGRIFVDIFHRIILEQAKLHDTNIYSCWQRNRLIGTIHLDVERQGLPGDGYLSFVSVVTGLFILYLAFRIGRNAIKHRKVK